jgi:hypothetical protein
LNLYGYSLDCALPRTYVGHITRKIIALLIAALLLLPVGIIYAARLSTNAVLNLSPVVAEGPSAEDQVLVGFIGSKMVAVIIANGMRTVILSDQNAKSAAANASAVKNRQDYQ